MAITFYVGIIGKSNFGIVTSIIDTFFCIALFLHG